MIVNMMMSWSHEEDVAPIMLIVSTSVCLEPVSGDGEAGDEESECMEAATLPSSPSTVTQVCRFLNISMLDMHIDIYYLYPRCTGCRRHRGLQLGHRAHSGRRLLLLLAEAPPGRRQVRRYVWICVDMCGYVCKYV